MNRRGRAQPPRTSRPPTTHIATRPGEVWCWDVTFLPAQIQGCWFYFYLILDLYSRKIVGFEVHDTDSAEHAAHLARRTALAEGVHAKPVRPVLHGDNGATLKATTVLAMLHWLGIEPSYARPRVSDDNAFAEALFRTAKYRPEFPLKGFADLDAARQWAGRFVHWYNHTPPQRHPLCHPGAAPCRPGPQCSECPPRDLPSRAGTQSATLEWVDPQLDTGRRRHPQSRARQHRPGGDLPNPAFRFDRSACFPAPTWQHPSRGAQRRRWEEQSHPEPRAARPIACEHGEDGEDGEHRTFSAVSTVAHSSPVGG
jgi:putative transposase